MEEVDDETRRKRDPRNFVFGFGRRLVLECVFATNAELTSYKSRQCPGNKLVDSSLWLLIASMLATLDISKPVDDAGNVIEPKPVFENPIFRYAGSHHY